ncbi:hypothetical protein EG329_001665 [Mollisiaceae sp. DMI_Dod_QoI]|nr:hypothetical protein EG329_001665 [Helotiales sp. DMI_Dod_QoI]
MSSNAGTTKPTSLGIDTPSVKRQKTASGYNSTSTSANNTGAYNSDNDSGDELLADFVPDTPGHGYQTQPTQILPNGTNLRSSPPGTPKTVVQVPASSPFYGRDSEPRPVHNAARLQQQTGVIPPRQPNLAMSMAPAGTVFKAPQGVVKKPFQFKQTIDLLDDDGPQFQGDSSDDELGVDIANIKPTTFVPGSANSSFGASPSKDTQVSVNGNSRFKSVVANAEYKGPANGRPDAMSRGYGSVKKPQTQMRPERAQPVSDLNLNEFADAIRRKITQIITVLPHVSIMTAHSALLAAPNFNVNDALSNLMAQQEKNVIVINSDDEIESPASGKKQELQMKRGLNGGVGSIGNRYSKFPALPKPSPVATPPKPKKKLVQGRRHPSSPAMPQVSSPLKPQAFEEEEEEEEEEGSVGSDSDSASGEEEDESPDVEPRVLKFLNTCQLKELVEMTSLKQNNLEIMIAARPFRTLDAAREVENTKVTKSGKKSARAPIGDKIVDKCLDMFRAYEAVASLEKKCAELGKPVTEEMAEWGLDVFGASKGGEIEITSLEDDINPQRDSGLGSPNSDSASNNGDDDIKTQVIKRKRKITFLKQPDMMAEEWSLKDYQVVGLNWLDMMYRHGLSCILADDMGLGKTYQVIAFLTHLVENGQEGPHIVVCPGSTLENWLREFQKFSPKLMVEPYHGPQKERVVAADNILANDQVNVVVTTYDMADGNEEDQRFLRRLRSDVCVYDEGHVLKNTRTKKYRSLMKNPAKFRLLLTGTPLQNNLGELVALLAFILPGVFNYLKDDLDLIFKAKATTQDTDHAALLSKERIDRARSILTPFVLRRKKEQVLKHLPTKTCRIEYASLHDSQKGIYDSLLDGARERARFRIEGGKAPKSDENNPLMQLRKAAIHPLLFRRHFTEEKIREMADILRKRVPESFPPSQKLEFLLKEMRGASDFWLHMWCVLYPCIRKFDIPDLAWMNSGKVESLVKLVTAYKEKGDRVLIFSQFSLVLDILEAVLNSSSIQFIRIDGSTNIDERQPLIDTFRDNQDITAFLLTTKAGGTGINLMYANKVIIFDSSFNPQDDKQAENRAHRVGQQKDVEVVRLVTRGTVEEQIFALGQSKLELDGRVAGDDDAAEAAGEKALAKMFLEGTGISKEIEEVQPTEEEPKPSQGKLPSRKKSSILDMLTKKDDGEMLI